MLLLNIAHLATWLFTCASIYSAQKTIPFHSLLFKPCNWFEYGRYVIAFQLARWTRQASDMVGSKIGVWLLLSILSFTAIFHLQSSAFVVFIPLVISAIFLSILYWNLHQSNAENALGLHHRFWHAYSVSLLMVTFIAIFSATIDDIDTLFAGQVIAIFALVILFLIAAIVYASYESSQQPGDLVASSVISLCLLSIAFGVEDQIVSLAAYCLSLSLGLYASRNFVLGRTDRTGLVENNDNYLVCP